MELKLHSPSGAEPAVFHWPLKVNVEIPKPNRDRMATSTATTDQ